MIILGLLQGKDAGFYKIRQQEDVFASASVIKTLAPPSKDSFFGSRGLAWGLCSPSPAGLQRSLLRFSRHEQQVLSGFSRSDTILQYESAILWASEAMHGSIADNSIMKLFFIVSSLLYIWHTRNGPISPFFIRDTTKNKITQFLYFLWEFWVCANAECDRKSHC